MALKFFKIWNGLNIGAQASDPANGAEGDTYRNSTSNSIRVFINGLWRDLLTQANANQYDAIVSNPAIGGFSTHTTITAALAAVSDGAEILVMKGTYAENLTITKPVHLVGQGKSSYINGTITFDTGADQSIVEKVRFGDNISFTATTSKIFLTPVFLDSGKTVSDLGTDNHKLVIVS